jgi:glycine/D-amino acid oxidase-like deaminating enzyme
MKIPMQGIKSTSIVWKAPVEDATVDATALFCGEDNQFGTHLEVYPRPDYTIYICGIGGSDYIDTEQLKAGAFRDECLAKASRVEAAVAAFTKMSSSYRNKNDALDRVQACMQPCPPDALPYMGSIPGYNGAFLNAGHN